MNPEIHTQLEKFKEELGKLEPAVYHLKKADESVNNLLDVTAKFVTVIDQLLVENGKISKSTSGLIDKIEKVNFPDRFEKLEISLNSINSSFNDTKLNLKELKSIGKTIQLQTEEINQKIEESKNTLLQINDDLKKATENINELDKKNTESLIIFSKEIIENIDLLKNMTKQYNEGVFQLITKKFELQNKQNKVLKTIIIITSILIVGLITFGIIFRI